ncbi:MAG: DUF3883 domain-containing protein [Bryobacterales bacterium]|nr:DUF3883 domain-containing protein [Bryobacterales bacterium]
MQGEPWTLEEQRRAVADYLEMLRLELGGRAYNKAERNRRLQARLEDRTKGSVEYKHRNISAVMERLGHPRIRGYRPAENIQGSLLRVVLAAIADDARMEALLAPEPPSLGPSPDGFGFGQAPPPLAAPREEEARTILSQHDPAERDARARALGKAGERFLLEFERRELRNAGRPDLAGLVRWVSKLDGDGAGYDILSYSPAGAERWLEVKTTNGPATTPFWITANERRVSRRHPDKFLLARIFDFSRSPGAFELRPPLSAHVALQPTVFRAALTPTGAAPQPMTGF